MTSSSIALAAKMVFSSPTYVALAAAIATAFWIIFNAFDGLLIFSPLSFYLPIPEGAIPGFILSNIMAPLLGIVVSMNMYIFKNSRAKMGVSFFSGSALSTVSSMCVGCSSVGFFLATTLGGAGVAVSSFLSNYQVPLRLVALGLLVWAYYSASRKMTKSCAVQ